MFHLIVTLQAKTITDEAPVAAALARMRPVCLREAGCVSWDAYQSQVKPGAFVLVEHWQTREHWEAHDAMSAIQEIYIPDILPRITREVHPSTALGHAAEDTVRAE